VATFDSLLFEQEAYYFR